MTILVILKKSKDMPIANVKPLFKLSPSSSELEIFDDNTDWTNLPGQPSIVWSTIKVLVKIQWGTIDVYENSGFAADDFSSPDFNVTNNLDGASPGKYRYEAVSPITLVTDSDNVLVGANHTITLKYELDDGINPVTVFSDTYSCAPEAGLFYSTTPDIQIENGGAGGTVTAYDNNVGLFTKNGVDPLLEWSLELFEPAPSITSFTETSGSPTPEYSNFNRAEVESTGISEGSWQATFTSTQALYEYGTFFVDFINNSVTVNSIIAFTQEDKYVGYLNRIFCSYLDSCGMKRVNLECKFKLASSMYQLYRWNQEFGFVEENVRVKYELDKILGLTGSCESC